MDKRLITIGYDKGEIDFSINGSILDLTFEQFNELRIMIIVAIGQAESMRKKYGPPMESKVIKD